MHSGPFGKLGETMLHETKANDKPQRNRSPPSDRKSAWRVQRNVLQRFLAISCRAQNSVHVQFVWRGSRSNAIPHFPSNVVLPIWVIHSIGHASHAVGSAAICVMQDFAIPLKK